MSRKLAGFCAAELLAGVGDDVEGRHDQPGAVADDADAAVELDVVEVLLLGQLLERVDRAACPRARRATACRKPAFSSRVTLPSSATTLPSAVRISGFTSTSVASSPTKTFQSFSSSSAAPSSALAGRWPASAISRALARSTPVERVDRHPGQHLGLGGGDLLDLHAALDRAHREERAVGAVEQERDVVLLARSRSRSRRGPCGPCGP